MHNERQLSNSPPAALLPGTLRNDEDSGQSLDPDHKKAFLTVIRGKADLGTHTFIDDRAVVGRDPSCELPLLDHRVSRRHATIVSLGADDYMIQDLGSTNGTRVADHIIAGPHPLRDGDKIQMGDTVIRFSLADEFEVHFQSEVATLVGTDPLTGLPTKRRFDEALEFGLQAAKQSGTPLAVLMMDMDGVKQINDTHGHLFGAHAIRETGHLIAHVIGSQGSACRFGGDEFSAFLPGQNSTAAIEVAQQIRLAVETANLEKDGIALQPTISIGIAALPEDGNGLVELVEGADRALYRAKAQGKNCVSL